MNEFWIKVIINIIIGLIIFIGFFTFWGRSSGWFDEGGIVYEYFKKKKEQKRRMKQQKRELKK